MGRRELYHTRRVNGIDGTLIAALVLIVLGYIFMHDLLGGTLLVHNEWDSYTLQAMAWRRGSFALDQNYEHLELAVYNGQYYVSFPPFPSVVMLPLTFIFGGDTPSNFVVMVAILLSVMFVYLCFKQIGTSSGGAIFWAVFFVLGSNMLWMSTAGGVWFLAQAFNQVLCFAAIYCMLVDRKAISLLLVALAVGCRPFSVVLLMVLFVWFCIEYRAAHKDYSVWHCVGSQLKYLLLPAIVGGVYLWYNYARFADPLEFGHNYLPEFTEPGSAQFGAHYIPHNVGRLLRPLTIDSNLQLQFPQFDGFLFFLANPMFLLWFIHIIKDILRGTFTAKKAMLCAGFVVNLLLLTWHKTLGGWQFGARYTVDLLPFVLLYILKEPARKPYTWEVFLGAFALLFNGYGALYMHFIS